MPQKPDLVLSGVNRGHNIGEDVSYSGTVAGALQGMAFGIRSIALSQSLERFHDEVVAHWETAEAFAPAIISRLLEQKWAPGVVMNLNFPNRPPEQVEAVEVTTQGFRDVGEMHAVRRTDLRGRDYYWMSFRGQKQVHAEGTDLRAVEEGRARRGAAQGCDQSRMNLRDDRAGRLILSLRQQGVTDPRVLSAMESIDRAVFVHEKFLDQAWEDQALPIDCAQTISQPYIVGLMTQALDVQPRHRVLEIGTGSGYQCAVLSRLARYVYSVERYRSLLLEAETRLRALQIDNVITKHGDGGLGWVEQAPFDRIMVTAASPAEPTELLKQLKPLGVLVAPVGRTSVQMLHRYVGQGDGSFRRESLTEVRFVPLVEGTAKEG
ncbi:hypothetical protein LTR94_026760 [Friedmanniomyces endolithicus]|nr:hypothetical protein LTR94_026760 [Friedmanniomyces endolithicus]